MTPREFENFMFYCDIWASAWISYNLEKNKTTAEMAIRYMDRFSN